ncbi:hypothetical protein [Goodfellowiella coeruleoviolacea]|uniref:Uncharacterized protein n=1 Tax=Goodfellowiella coeruleoviolacea TaxID=334858 RepID=A0AAE3GLX0_9PSEU|nr:hypothetical protein [Goodfellowiella coeruleoviolacea]MCP2169704.1 hypothetical protein [Goodfellowiella coeruleoviolacea]
METRFVLSYVLFHGLLAVALYRGLLAVMDWADHRWATRITPERPCPEIPDAPGAVAARIPLFTRVQPAEPEFSSPWGSSSATSAYTVRHARELQRVS